MKKSILILMLLVVFLTAGCSSQNEIAPQTSPITESTIPDSEAMEPDVIPSYDISDGLNDYITSVKEQSDSIKAFLEHDALTQADMNLKSQELYVLWDEALNYLWGELKSRLPEEEFAKLLDEQLIWIADKEKAVEEAGKEFEGGSLYGLVANSEAAEITEKRVHELYDLLTQ